MLEVSPSIVTQGQKPSEQSHFDAAQSLETHFISVFLKLSGLGENKSALSGGAGEEQFSSLLNDAYAKQISRSGGIGLAEVIMRTLVETKT